MPIHCAIDFKRLSSDEFHELDYTVMGQAFAVHNSLGRFCEEPIYQTDLAIRLQELGIDQVKMEFPVTVGWKTFKTNYSLDLVVRDAIIYELKAVTNLTGAHDAQLLNYLMLANAAHGKLINFRPLSVERRFVTTTLTVDDRHSVVIGDQGWQPLGFECERLRKLLLELLADWGAYLSVNLYMDALTCFFGGEDRVLQRVVLRRNGRRLGTQEIHLHAPEVAFEVTASTEYRDHLESHWRRFVAHTQLRALQWINLAHNQVDFVTIRND